MGFWSTKPPASPNGSGDSIVPDSPPYLPVSTTPSSSAALSVEKTVASEMSNNGTGRNSGSDGSGSGMERGSSGSGGSGGCPMHRADGTYSFDWRALWRAGFPHGPGGSKPLPPETLTAAVPTGTPPNRSTIALNDECPVSKSSSALKQQSLLGQNGGSNGGSSGGGCPVQKSNQIHRPEYNVYSQPIDPSNQMPFSPNQMPTPSQSVPLSTERVASTIPKGGAASEGSTWTFPSPQMFYNALARKGKLDETIANDMESVVAIHNNMNEKTWRKVLEWEHVTAPSSSSSSSSSSATIGNTSSDDGRSTTPKLLKFEGRPTDLSPKAAMKHYLLGHPLPYDRHDWVIERPDGTTVRYVIDYYHDESQARDDPDSAHPALNNHTDGSNSLLVDVRPALDSPRACWNRIVTMPYAQTMAQSTRFEALPLEPSTNLKGQVQESINVWRSIQAASTKSPSNDESTSEQAKLALSEARARRLAQQFDKLRSQCRVQQKALQQCATEDDCARASLDVTICMAQIVCPVQHAALVQRLGETDATHEDAIAQALVVVQDCVTLQAEHHAVAQTKFPHVFIDWSVSASVLLAETEVWVQPAQLVLDPFLNVMSFAMLARVVLSWYPETKLTAFPWVLLVFPTEPLLRIVKGVVPPAFGVDITPVFWLAIFTFVHEILLGQQGLLTMKIKYGI